MNKSELDRWPFFYRRMQRREGRRAAAYIDYRNGALPPRYPLPALIDAELAHCGGWAATSPNRALRFPSLALAAALTCYGAAAAQADPIFVSGFLPAALTYTPLPGSVLSVTSSGFFGLASYKSDTGSGIFGAMSFVTQPLSAGAFTIVPSAPETFVYSSATDSDSLSVALEWNQLVNGGEAELVGTGTVTAVSGDAEFLADYHLGDTITADGFFPTECALSGGDDCNILAGGQIGFFEGGDVTPPGEPRGGPPDDVPEPEMTLAFIGAALVVAWWGVRRRQTARSGMSAEAI